ncbi:hypothetical protein Tsubulata_032578 [Turnera subulata]|uniref:Glycosyl transferase CAP10 domain-containing protein n=1 Tax=Turnera subulata TaxID=218843 RepID=A0A9Q0F2X5_9ROSI|nr:hypothetical protein Tsubulata_032578 [Turnera subulata]
MREKNSLINTNNNTNMQQQRLTDRIWRSVIRLPATSSSSSSSVVLLCLVLGLLVGAFLSTRYLHFTTAPLGQSQEHSSSVVTRKINNNNGDKIITKMPPGKKENVVSYPPLNCTAFNLTRRCPPSPTPSTSSYSDSSSSTTTATATCPEYFRWIHEDLRPWATTGISREMVESARRTANFRLVVVEGKAYVEVYEKGFQSRDTFTLWGILQLLRRYRLPDLDIMFDCVDWPVVNAADFIPNATAPPPLFRYCGDDRTLDIVFPDWSFWGWHETNIKPWGVLLQDLKEGNERMPWAQREPYAYWKGNPEVAATRQDLMKCNVTPTQDWNARVFAQDWVRESQQGYKQSDLSNQCNYRYKIYIEGSAWSVSEKYILACDSVTLLVKPHYYDFFTRGLFPNHHYWPVNENDKCRSIKFAVDWGNAHEQEAQAMGKAASEFIQNELKMDYVYDYMFHVLNEYAKLLTYKPVIPPNAAQLCPEAMACLAQGREKKFMMDSLEKAPAETSPCTLPPPFDPPSLYATLKKKHDSIQQVESWEKHFWDTTPPNNHP